MGGSRRCATRLLGRQLPGRPRPAPLEAATAVGRQFARQLTGGQVAAVLAVEQSVSRLGPDVLQADLYADPWLAARFSESEITLALSHAVRLGRLRLDGGHR